MRQVKTTATNTNVTPINTQAQTPSVANVLDLANMAVDTAEAALIKAKEALASIGGNAGSKGRTSKAPKAQTNGNGSNDPANDSKGSAGRNPSPEQLEIRNIIIESLQSGELVYFTIAEVTEQMKADRIQTRNAVNYLEAQGIVTRYGEKLPEGRGQRELIYKAGVVPEAPKG